jgi:hypothetical protein
LVEGTGKEVKLDLNRCAAYCTLRGLKVAFVAHLVDDALRIIANGDADVLVCLSAMPLYPRIQILTLAGDETDRQRRTRRVHRLYPAPVEDDPRLRRPQELYPPVGDDDPRKRRPNWRTGRVEPPEDEP